MVDICSDSTLAFLQTHGLALTPGEMEPLLAEAVSSLQQTLYRADPRQDLTRSEAEALERAGFELNPADLGSDDPLARSAAQYAALIKTSLSTSRVAGMLDVKASSVRKRLSSRPPTLFGIRLDFGWHIPRFQFDGDRPLPGLGEVIARLDRELHPVAVYRWFTMSHPDLIPDSESEDGLSPRDWLRLGFSPVKLGQLAADL
jgi:hypothetical protein